MFKKKENGSKQEPQEIIKILEDYRFTLTSSRNFITVHKKSKDIEEQEYWEKYNSYNANVDIRSGYYGNYKDPEIFKMLLKIVFQLDEDLINEQK